MVDGMDAALKEATAACGAFLLVAAADARIESIEESRFLGGVVNDPAFKRLSTEDLASEYNRLLASLTGDYDAAEAEILTAIGSIRRDPVAVETVKIAARNAVVADDVLKPQEDIVLGRIALALGVEPDDF